MIKNEVIIIGAGPAGMAAAVKLNELGFRDVLILEKEDSPGGVLRQCI
ncbi:MAG: NAD(P)-binding protein, partial [Firmicutes bacterium]|nr:NAD(P)-binding protein [Bacillota bacterium]